MNRIRVIALFTLVMLTAATKLVAQEHVLEANIPFNFTVGEKSMPAGEYTVSSPSRNIVKIQSTDGQHVEFVSSSQSYHGSAVGSELVFDKYGEYYFLHRILSPKNTLLNLDVALGKVEKEVQTREARLQTGEQVLVAAR